MSDSISTARHTAITNDEPEVWELIFRLLSKDTHIFERNGQWVFYGKHSGYLEVISSSQAEFLTKYLKGTNAIAPDEQIDKAVSAREFILSLVKKINSKKLVHQEISSPRSVQIIVSDACNMQCSYCYGEYYDARNHNKLMSVSTALKAVDFAASIDAQHIGFFGGEPLINFTAIKAAIEYANTCGHKFQYGITTNGTLVTPVIADYFRAHNVQVSVSLDGGPQSHDLTRRYKNGKGTYSDVLDGISILRDHECLDMVEMTYSNKHSTNLKAMLKELSLHCSSISCTCVEGRGKACFNDEIVRGDRLRKYYNDMFDFVLDEKVKGRDVNVGGINELISGVLSPYTFARKYLCSTILDRVTVAHDGTVYPCPETMTTPFSILNILNDFTVSEFATKRLNVLEKLTMSNLSNHWFSNLTDICVARVSHDPASAHTIEDSEYIGAALEDVLYKVATL